jgi:hypothetical protein
MSGATREQLVDEIVEDLLKGELTLAESRTRYSEQWSDIGSSVEAAYELHSVTTLFNEHTAQIFDKEKLWERLQSQITPPANANNANFAADSGSNLPSNVVRFEARRRFRDGWMGKVAAAMIIVMLVSGLFVASAEASSPGDFLYPTKLEIERIPEWFAFDDTSRQRLRLEYADRRLNEVEKAVSAGRYEGLDKAINSWSVALADAERLGLPEPQIVERRQRLQNLSDQKPLPPEVKKEIGRVVVPANRATPTATPAPTATVAPTVTPAPTSAALPMVTAAPLPTVTPAPTASATPTPVPTASATPTVPATGSVLTPISTTQTATATESPSATAVPRATQPPAPEQPAPRPTATAIPPRPRADGNACANCNGFADRNSFTDRAWITGK